MTQTTNAALYYDFIIDSICKLNISQVSTGLYHIDTNDIDKLASLIVDSITYTIDNNEVLDLRVCTNVLRVINRNSDILMPTECFIIMHRKIFDRYLLSFDGLHRTAYNVGMLKADFKTLYSLILSKLSEDNRAYLLLKGIHLDSIFKLEE